MDELHNSSFVSSPERQHALEFRHQVASGGGEQVVQNSEMPGNEQIGLTAGSDKQCDSIENLKTLDNSIKKSKFEPLTPHNPEYSLENANIESLERKEHAGREIGVKGSAETGAVASSELPRPENLEQPIAEQVRLAGEYPTSNSAVVDFTLLHENGASIPTFENLGSASCDAPENLSLQQSEPAEKDAKSVAGRSCLDKGTPKSSLLPPVSNRVLRSRSQEKPKVTDSKVGEVESSANEGRKRKQRMKSQMKKSPVNEFSRIRTHLRYLLHRVKYEKNLIDAYSAEGWKGQSLEKIKPEKELQRARSQILRYKLKIRDMFQHLDRSLSEGKLPESLFDSEGQIDSEDIFCARCGSKDLTLENDIILCDGACERGFHQFCLDPPLLKEDIPPDDEGWLCPGCDCKVDCIAMLNDFQGSTLTVLDNWEKVFPEEAAAAASGKSMDDIAGLLSDDSEDDDYIPDDPGLDREVSEDESSSDGSDYFSASDDAVPSIDDTPILGFPSDDSEDDDFDPSSPGHVKHAKQESSSSDFTSESEDLDALLEDGESPGNVQGHIPSVSDQSKPNAVASGGKLKAGKAKRQSLSDELSYLMESSAVPVSGKRKVERLDYKKLNDETYGDAISDSSDEDYGEAALPKRRKSSVGKAISMSNNEIQGGNDKMDKMNRNENLKESKHSFVENSHEKLKAEGSNNILGESQRNSSGVSSSGKNVTRSYKRLGEAVIQRLVESFKENQYPKHDAKESLAKELGLRVQQVSKWFENARWSFRHSSRMDSKMDAAASRNGNSSTRQISAGAEQNLFTQTSSCNGVEKIASSEVGPGNEEWQMTDAADRKLGSEASGQKSRKRKVDNEGFGADKCLKQDSNADAPKNQAVRESSRVNTRSRKSVE